MRLSIKYPIKYLTFVTALLALTIAFDSTAFAFVPDWTLVGDASRSTYKFNTTPSQNSYAGAVWNLTTDDLSFDFDHTAYVGFGNSGTGGDRLAFVLQNAVAGTGAGGTRTTSDQWMGLLNVYPAVAVEVDTHKDVAMGDPVCDHVAVDLLPSSGAGVPNHSGAAAVCALASAATVKDGAEHILRVTWTSATHTLKVYFDGTLRITYTNNIVTNIFGGASSVVFGFTGGTGSAAKAVNWVSPEDVHILTDIAVSKTVDAPTHIVGDTVIYSLEVRNSGPNDAPDVAVTDHLNSNLNFISAVPSVGSYDNGTGVWSVGPLVSGAASETLIITAQVTSEYCGRNVTNTAQSSVSLSFDTVSGNNSMNAPTKVWLNSCLTMTKTPDKTTVLPGFPVTYTIILLNHTDDSGTQTVSTIADTLPAGFTYVAGSTTGVTTSNPTIAGQVLTWSGAYSLAAENSGVPGQVTLSFQALAGNTSGTFGNSVNVNGPFILNFAINNVAQVTVGAPNIQLTKSVDKPAPKPGETVIFTIAYQNTGVLNAYNVIISDAVPVGLTYVPGSLRIGATTSTYATATPKTDAADADEATISGTGITYTFASIAANNGVAGGPDEGKVYFKAIVP